MAVGGAAGDGGGSRSGGVSEGGGQYGGRSGGLLGGTVGGVGLGGADVGSGFNDAGVAVSTRDEGGWTNSYNSLGQLVGSVRSGTTAAAAAQAAAAANAAKNGGGGTGNNGGAGLSDAQRTATVNQLNQQIKILQAGAGKYSNTQRAAQIASLQAQVNNLNQPAAQTQQQQSQAAQQQQQAAQQQAAQQAAAAEAARQAEAARVAEQQRQQRISVENQQRASLTQQLGQTTSAAQTQALQKQIAALGSEADNGAALNKALLDNYNKRFGEQTQQEKNSAIGAAQAGITTASPASLNYDAGPNTASVSSAVGTAISQTDQQKNAAEAARMGGYQDTSTMGRIGNVLKTTLSGLSAGGIPGAVLGGAASVYNNFISDRQSASSRALTQSMNPSKPTAADAASGMVTGALKGSVLGPLGLALGAIWGGATAAGVAPTADDLKGMNPLNNGVTADPNSYGPGQTLANGQKVGNGNGGGNGLNTRGTTTAPTLPSTSGGATASSGAGNSSAPSTGAPTSNNGTGKDETDARNAAGQSAFNDFLNQLRKRQMDNLLYTGAGWDKTSGTSLLGKVGAATGAVGGLTGQVISQWGGGKSLLGGAWSF